MGAKTVGLLCLAASLLIAGCGFLLTSKFRPEASYQGIASFRMTWRGLAFCGVLLIIFGLCLILPGILVLLP
jgi:hypothetical protein